MAQAYELDHALGPLVDAVHLACAEIEEEGSVSMSTWNTLADAWPMDNSDPKRYLNCRPPMYTTAGESGLSVPAVVNDVVFMATSGINLYAFNANDGTLLWQDALGMQTDGMNGGYGYCLGPAISGNYVVAGALVMGRDGGLLRIYQLQTS